MAGGQAAEGTGADSGGAASNYFQARHAGLAVFEIFALGLAGQHLISTLGLAALVVLLLLSIQVVGPLLALVAAAPLALLCTALVRQYLGLPVEAEE